MVRYDRIAYSPHALDSMSERAISEQVVLDVLADPGRTYASRDKRVAERVLGNGKSWRVVYVEERDDGTVVIRVVTVYRIDTLKR